MSLEEPRSTAVRGDGSARDRTDTRERAGAEALAGARPGMNGGSAVEGRPTEGTDAAEGAMGAEGGGAPVVVPESVEELSELLARASRDGRRVRCIGNATSLPPGHLDGPVDLVVSTRALDAVHAYDPADLTLTADAGVTLAQLERLTGDHGQWLPLDPPRRARRSLGGMLASGAYGPLQGKFGTPRDHVLGLTLVTGDGRVLELGGRVVKNVAGYDLVKLAVGSGGRLGIVTSATVRLHPLPVRDLTLLYQTPRLALAVVLARSLATATVRIPALELVAGHGGDPTVAVRLLGSPEAVEESERILCGRVGREASRRLEGEASARWFAALERFEEDAAAVARVSHLPSRLGDLAEPCVECGTLAAHVSLGVLRVAVGAGDRVAGAGLQAAGDAPEAGGGATEPGAQDHAVVAPEPARGTPGTGGGATELGAQDQAGPATPDPSVVFDALARLRDQVGPVGATFRVARANIPRWPEPAPATAPGVLALTRGIVDTFDPAGVLSRRGS